MSALLTIFRRELGAYFNSSIAAIFLIVFAFFTNGVFLLQFFQGGKADMRPLFGSLPFILNIFIPAISMRLWAEDKRGNTFELLMTFPVRPQQLVLGKFLAGLAFYLTALATTLTVPVMISWAGRMDLGLVAGSYLGAVLMGAFFLAIGIFISGLSKDQIVAFILTVIAIFGVFFVGLDPFATALDGWMAGVGTFIKESISVASHLSAFGKGVVDVRDLLYFLIGIVMFLFLNAYSLEGRYRPKAKLVFSAAVALSLVSFILAGWLVRDLPLGRFDLTEQKLNTISPATQKLLGELKVPVRAKFYVSPAEKMPTAMKTLEREVMDRLEELSIAADGKLEARVVHLDTVEQTEEMKAKLKNDGVVPFQVESVQRDEVGVKLVYSTLVLEYKEKAQEILPRVIPQALGDLEYQLMSRIVKLTMDEKPKVAVFAPVAGQELSPELADVLEKAGQKDEKMYEDRFKTAVTLMRNNGYDVSRIALTKDSTVPEGAKAFMIFDPGELSDRQRYEINRYLFRGGTVLLAAQGFEYTYAQQETGMESVPKKKSLSINRLIERWGAKINEEILMDERSNVISLTSGQRIGPFALQIPVKFPTQLMIAEDSIDREAPIMKRIPAVAYLWGSALELQESALKAARLRSKVLFTSSGKSWTVPYNGQNLNAENTKPPKEYKGKMPLAALIEGQFSDTFGGQAPSWTAGEAATPAPTVEAKPGRLFLIGCSQAFSEDLLQNAGNLALFANAVDGLILGDELIQIRSKAPVVSDLRPLSNAEKLWYRFFAVFLVPVLLSLASLLRHFLRRKEKEFYLSAVRAEA